jgi:hypothetical protein
LTWLEGVSVIMNFSELQREVKAIILDASPAILLGIPDYINEAIQQIAEEVRFPELKQITSVNTSISTYCVNMPSGFSSRLVYAGDSSGEYKVLDGGIEDLIRLYPSLDESGDIKHLLLEGNVLYYQPIPTVVTAITCVGYFAPDTLVNDNDTPSVIPSYLHREAIVNKAAAVAYNIIEDEIDVGKVNTKLMLSLAEVGINKIRAYISKRRSVISSSSWRY